MLFSFSENKTRDQSHTGNKDYGCQKKQENALYLGDENQLHGLIQSCDRQTVWSHCDFIFGRCDIFHYRKTKDETGTDTPNVDSYWENTWPASAPPISMSTGRTTPQSIPLHRSSTTNNGHAHTQRRHKLHSKHVPKQPIPNRSVT